MPWPIVPAPMTATRVRGRTSCRAGRVYDPAGPLRMVGADAIDAPAHQALRVARIVHRPRNDRGTETVYGLHQRVVQCRTFLPQRLCRRIVERLARILD